MEFQKINELRENGKYSKVVLALEDAYNISKNTFTVYGIEATADELKVNDELGERLEGETVYDGSEVEIKDESETVDSNDATNILDVFGIYNNKYRVSFAKFLKRNEGFIDYDNHFNHKDRTEFADIIKPAMKMLEIVYNNDKELDSLNKLCEIVSDRGKMGRCMGTKDAPFVYEGIQLAFSLKLLILLALVPNHLINTKATVDEIVDTLGSEVIKTVFSITEDIISMKNVLGTKIIYVDTPKSEITGHGVDKITGSIYQHSAVLNEKDTNGEVLLAGESIENLLTIKNNGALVESSLLFKGLSIIAKIAEELNVKSLLKECYEKVRVLLSTSEIENVKDSVDSLVEWTRTSILMQLENKYKELNDDPELTLNDVTPDEYKEDAPEVTEEPTEEVEEESVPSITDFD